MSADDVAWMRRALELAEAAGDAGEVPVGALVVSAGTVLGEGWNQPISACDPTAHAEIVALRAAARRLGNYRLGGATVYATMEPCPMCAGALVHARIARLVYAARDERWGACGSVLGVLDAGRLNHDVAVTGGVLAEDSARMLREFFGLRRGRIGRDA